MKLERATFGFGIAILALGTRPGSTQCEGTELADGDGEAGELFGRSVALYGDTALVGSPSKDVTGSDSGAVYVFELQAGAWVQTARLTPLDAAAGDAFGSSVALFRDAALVGAPGDDGAASNAGAAYVFERTGTSWSQVAELAATAAAAGDAFGAAVALFDGVAAVGAPGDDSASEAAGAVHVFEGSGTSWSPAARLTASDATSGNFLGTSVSLADGVVVAGGAGFDGPPGRAYVFERSLGGTWGPTETARLLPSAGAPIVRFGFSVAVAGGVALVGDPLDNPGSFGSGAVYVFERSAPGAWSTAETAKLTVDHGQDIVELGWSLSLWGTRALASARETHRGTGAAYVFELESGSWSQVAAFRSPVGGFDSFGDAASIFGDAVLVSASTGDGLVPESGVAYVFAAPGFAEAYCFCDSDAEVCSVHGGGGCPTSIGRGALLNACGSGSVSADDLVMTASGVPPDQTGIFFMGAGRLDQPFGDGLRCVGAGGAGIFRFLPPQDSGPAGTLTLGPGIVAHSIARFAGAGHIVAGDTWNFQNWFRDPFGPCGSAFNLSNALAVSFAP